MYFTFSVAERCISGVSKVYLLSGAQSGYVFHLL